MHHINVLSQPILHTLKLSVQWHYRKLLHHTAKPSTRTSFVSMRKSLTILMLSSIPVSFLSLLSSPSFLSLFIFILHFFLLFSFFLFLSFLLSLLSFLSFSFALHISLLSFLLPFFPSFLILPFPSPLLFPFISLS